MAVENRRRWLDLLAAKEGGRSDRPLKDDPGGKTNRGVTLDTLAEWRKRPVTVEELWALTVDEAEAIASAMYWNPVKGDELPGGVDLYAADTAFHSGPRQAIKILQRLLGFQGDDVDGYVGPLTLRVCRQWEPVELVRDYHAARMVFLQGLKNWSANRNGWTNRCEAMLELACKVAPAEAPAVVAKQADRTDKVTAGVGVTAGAVTVIVASLPAAKETYEQTVTALTPLGELASWLPIAGGAVAAMVILFLALRNMRLRDAVQ